MYLSVISGFISDLGKLELERMTDIIEFKDNIAFFETNDVDRLKYLGLSH